MSILGDALTTISTSVIPAVCAEVLPDVMDIKADTNTTDSGGAYRKSATSTAYASVPVAYEPTRGDRRIEQGGKQLSTQEYLVTFPFYTTAGTRITATISHRFVVAARGSEPAKTFRPIALKDQSGVYQEWICAKEN